MKISIVIPTRERAEYLGKSIATATAIDDPDIEIVVSDNASDDDTRAVVGAIDDPRLRYLNTGKRLSMRQNFEFALGESTGDYVIFFGDDDGILAGQFPILRALLNDHAPDALSWDFPVYGWPVRGYGARTGGLRFKPGTSFGAPRPLDAEARRAAMSAGQMTAMYPMPGIYHGCMRRGYLDDLRTADGICFAARSPDVYINFRALVRGGRFVHAHHPFSINGYSPASTGGSLRDLGQTDGTRKTADTFLSELAVDPVDDVLPVALSMSLAFLGTLETVRHHFPDEPVVPDYGGWFAHAMTDMARKDPRTAASIRESMDLFAERLGAQAALAAARSRGPEPALSRLRRAWRRFAEKRGGFRLSAEHEGENTILSAARVCDRVLGQDLSAVIDGSMTRPAAWARARNRSRDFARQI